MLNINYRRSVLALLMLLASIMVINNDPLFAQESVALPDPTRPYSGAVEPVQSEKTGKTYFNLQSTLVSEGRTSAIINGHLLKVGETISGARIIEIKPHQVVVQSDGKKRTLHLLQGKVVTASKTIHQAGWSSE